MKERLSHKSVSFEFGALFTLLAFVMLLALVPPSTAQQDNRQLKREQTNPSSVEQRRTALVIGNGAYQNVKPLRNPPNDATLLATTLKKLGFEVTVGTDKSQREMKQLIREFGQRLRGGGGVGLFYFAGHGVQARGHNYLVPVDADIQTEADLEDAAVDVNYVLNMMDDAQNALNIAILDACRNNPFGRSFRSAQEGLAQVKAPTGTLIAYATSPDSVAADGGGANSPYAEELTKQIQVSGVLLETMFRRVAEQVSSRSGGRQEPWYSANVKGDFFFSNSPTNSSLSNTPAKIDAVAVEREYWETIRSSNDSQDYKDYLQAYPSGAYAAIARAKIRQLETASKPSQNDVPIASRPVIKPSTTSNGLVAYWPFNGNAKDESGHGFHGIVYGATLTNDRFGNPAKAYDFDGTKNYIAFPSVSLSNLSRGTVSVWFKLGSLNRTQVIIDKTITNSVNYFQLNIHYNSLIHNKIMLRTNERYGTNSNLLSDMSPSIAEWHNIVAVWDGTVGKIYLDGRLEASASMSGSIPASDRSVLAGKADNDTAYLKGTIDDIRIYNRVLSEEEIRRLYNEKS